MSSNLKRNMAVTVSGLPGTIVYCSLNKVKVRFEDGTEKMVSYHQIKTPSK